MRCKKCGISLKEGAKFCPSCGTKTEPDTAPDTAAVSDTIPCPGCGQPIKKDAKFCPFCGAKNDGQNEAPKCTVCGAELKPGVKFCPSCGNSTVSDTQPAPIPVTVPSLNDAPPVPETPTINTQKVEQPTDNETKPCPNCGKELKATAKFCPFCGGDANAAPKAEEPAVTPVTDEAPKVEEPAVENVDPLNGDTAPVPQINTPASAAQGTLPQINTPAPAAQETLPQINTPAPAAQETLPQINAPAAQGTLPQINTPAPAAQGTLPQINAPAPAAQGTLPQINATAAQPQGSIPQVNGAATVKQKNKALPFIILGIGGVIVIAIIIAIIVMIVSNQKKEIDVSEYIDIRLSENAYDGDGYAELEFNSTKFSEDWKDQLKYSRNPRDYASSSYIAEDDPSTFIAYVLKNNYCYSLDKSDSLSNGDTINVKWDISDSLKETIDEYVNCDLVFSDKSFTVEGLKGLDSVDLFEGVDVEFSGQAPYGSASVTGAQYGLTYSLDKDEGLSNGDKVTVTVSAPYSDEDLTDYMRSYYHATFSDTTKTFTVSGLTKTVTAISEIDDESLTKMKHETEDLIKANVANNENATLKSTEYLGMILLSPKNADSYYNDYLYYTVYKVVVSITREVSGKQTTGTLTYYTYGKFENLVIVDGKISSDLSANDPYDSVYYDNTWISFDGYKSLDALNNDVVTKHLDSYKSESNVKEKTTTAPEPSKPEESSKVEESSKEESSKEESSKAEESSKEESSKVEESSKEESGKAEESSKEESSKSESSKTESSKNS